MYRNRFLWIVGPIFCLLSGCGYHFGNIKRNIPGGYDKIAVPVFTNRTPEVGVEPYFTEALIEEFERSHVVRVTTNTDAQVVMDGEVVAVQYIQGAAITKSNEFPNLPDDAVLTKEYRIIVRVNLNLRRISDNSILWTGEFSGEQRYAAPQVTADPVNSVNPLYNQSARQMTMKILARAMMTEAHDRLTENF